MMMKETYLCGEFESLNFRLPSCYVFNQLYQIAKGLLLIRLHTQFEGLGEVRRGLCLSKQNPYSLHHPRALEQLVYVINNNMKKKLDGLSDTQGYREESKQENKEEEIKNSIEIKHKSHRQKTSPQYLFQVEDDPSKLHVFCILKKELKTYEVSFTFPGAMGF